MALKTVVTGYPRGATRWAHRVLSSAGCDAGFCSVFTEQSNKQYTYKAVADAPHEIEVSWFAAPFHDHPALQNVKIVRLDRHPLAVASSLLWLGVFKSAHSEYVEQWRRYLTRHAPELDEEYRGKACQSSLYLACEWAENVLQLSTYPESCVKVEGGADALLAACGVPSCSGVDRDIAPCNVSGCRQIQPSPMFSIYDRVMKVVEDRGYVDHGWNNSEIAAGYCST